MARPKHQNGLKRATFNIRTNQDEWMIKIARKEHTNKNMLVRLALDELRRTYDRDGRLPADDE